MRGTNRVSSRALVHIYIYIYISKIVRNKYTISRILFTPQLPSLPKYLIYWGEGGLQHDRRRKVNLSIFKNDLITIWTIKWKGITRGGDSVFYFDGTFFFRKYFFSSFITDTFAISGTFCRYTDTLCHFFAGNISRSLSRWLLGVIFFDILTLFTFIFLKF